MRMNRVKTLGMIILIVLLMPYPEANAIPSFARQTGMDYSACHTVFPELTSFGRVMNYPPLHCLSNCSGGFTVHGRKRNEVYHLITSYILLPAARFAFWIE